MCKDKDCKCEQLDKELKEYETPLPSPHDHDKEAREVVDEIEKELSPETPSPELEELYKLAAEDLARSEVVGLPSTDEASARDGSLSRYGPHKVTPRVNKADGTKLGRNDPCACGSGKKYKKCECWELLNQ